MKIALLIYIICMFVYDLVVLSEIVESSPETWTWKDWIRAILILIGLGLIWPVCLVVAALRGRER